MSVPVYNIEILKKIIQASYIKCGSSYSEVKIDEPQNKSKDNTLKSVTFNNFRNEGLINNILLQFENNTKENLSPCLNSPHNRICDGVIIRQESEMLEESGKLKVLCIELKGSETGDAKQQLLNAKCFIEYAFTTFNQFHKYGIYDENHGYDDIGSLDIEYAAVIFKKRKPQKHASRPIRKIEKNNFNAPYIQDVEEENFSISINRIMKW
jgi:hypothetical protein